MSKIEKSIDVAVPVRVAYDQWTQFEEFPRFMDGVESVKQVDDTHLHWVATIGGVRKEWDAVITQQEPDQRIAWNATNGAENAGAVDFHRLDDSMTRVNLTMDIDPDGRRRDRRRGRRDRGPSRVRRPRPLQGVCREPGRRHGSVARVGRADRHPGLTHVGDPMPARADHIAADHVSRR